MQREADNKEIEKVEITLENPKTVIPRAKSKPVNFRETHYGADIEYLEKKLPKPYHLDNEL